MNAMIGTGWTLASYFAFTVDSICQVLWREGNARGPQELVRLTHNRIRRLGKRFGALLARWQAGTLRPVVGEKITPHPDPPGQSSGRARGRGQSLTPPQGGRESNAVARGKRAAWPFPRARGWLVRQLAPSTGPQCVGTLCLAWEDAEMREFYAAAPQLGRILRPLAQMIGAPLPAWLKLPKRARKPGLRRHTAATSRLRDERSELIVPNRRLPAREQAEDAVRRSETFGKPINLRLFTAEALGWFLHPPRDGNCPPPKIGYAGRRRRPPKDYRPPWD